jgi:hypothetical protein
MKKLNYQIMGLLLFFLFSSYVVEFYLLGSQISQQFWCVEVVKDFRILSFENLRLPVHCDEGPYRFASASIDNFFNSTNPYQGRPLFVGILFLLRNFIGWFTFFGFDDYQNYRIAMLILQFIILFSIVKVFISITSLKLESKNDYFIIFLLLSIPSIRWNILLSSVGNITFLLLLISMYSLKKRKLNQTFVYKIFLLFGFLSLIHMSAIVYAFIVMFFLVLKDKKFRIKDIFLNICSILGFQIVYRLIVSISKYEFYDWHREVYNQFYWIISALRGESQQNCQTFSTFLACNNQVTASYISYFILFIICISFLLFLGFYLKKPLPQIVSNLVLINTFIFIFWTFQGLYEPFRFVNYSIGYTIFLTAVLLTFVYDKNLILITSLLIYNFSIVYLEPYNTALKAPQINDLTLTSGVFFVLFLFVLIREIKDQNITN